MRKILIAALVAAPLGGFAYQAFAKDAGAPVLAPKVTAADDMGLGAIAAKKKITGPIGILGDEGGEMGENHHGLGHESGESGFDD